MVVIVWCALIFLNVPSFSEKRKKWVRTEKVSLEKYGNRLSKQDVHMFSRRVMVWFAMQCFSMLSHEICIYAMLWVMW